MANITQTTLTGAVNQNGQSLPVAATTNLTAPSSNQTQNIYVINPDQTRGELMSVQSVGTLQASVTRLGMFRQSFVSGAIVLIAPVNPALGGFFETDPTGSPSVAGSYPAAPTITPWVNVTNGNQWLQGIGGQWVPGWNNPTSVKGVTAAVASLAGVVLPSGPLFHITGTNAITGFTIPVGFAGGSFTVIPDAVFTWTAAGNISVLGTAVVNRALTFTWDSNAGKFEPSYV